MTNFQIEVISDTVCPWCYIGKKRLEAGIALYQARQPPSTTTAADTFSTTWLPFYLNPGAPKEGVDKKGYYESKFGAARTEAIFARLGAAGAAHGIAFRFGGKTGNTRDSHRLIELGKTKGADAQTRVVDALFRAYFENEQDITSHAVLTRAGVEAGLPEDEVRLWLESDKGGSRVDDEVRRAQLRDIGGVPHFTIQGRYEIGGAEDPAEFVRAFELVKKAEQSGVQ
ncbi:MAG: hypothetical protein M1819_004736 [Sarea resinae]|nr:MAG: hypothetical protein M1819_004736 [Sarea resinae]